MSCDLLSAICNLITTDISAVSQDSHSSNRINSVWESFEWFVKDMFSNTLAISSMDEKLKAYADHFSYLWNQNNPPDIMIRGGDAIEVKKIQSRGSSISLNSSYPKNRLYSESTQITKECKECEDWEQKDILYIIWVCEKEKIRSIWLVYGDCFAANKSIYERVKSTISEGLTTLNLDLSTTNELGRVNKVDPLGVTYLRIRWMWGIENPDKVFSYLEIAQSENFSLNALMLWEKYASFSQASRSNIENLSDVRLKKRNVLIKSPNNWVDLLDWVLISFTK